LIESQLLYGGVVSKEVVDIRSLQKPFKTQYRADPQSSHITLTAKGGGTNTPLSCSVDIGRAIYQTEAHKGMNRSSTAACSGDLLLGALAACAQLTCQLVATAMGIETRHIAVTVDGDMDLSGTLGISKEVLVGFSAMRVKFEINASSATFEQLQSLQEKTEQYCVVLQTLLHPPKIESTWITEG